MEVWKNIPNYEGYQVSNLGRIKSLKFGKERILKLTLDKIYLTINLSKNGKSNKKNINQLVVMAFLNHKPNGNKGLVVDHINNIKTDNRVENLQLITNRENSSKDRKGSNKYTGVYWNKKAKKYIVQIGLKSKRKTLGYFKNPKIAYAVYLNKLENIF